MINASDLYYNNRPIELETTSLKFSNYLSSSNENIPCNTSGGSFNITLPNLGNRVRVFDAVGNSATTGFGLNSLFILPNVGTTVMGSDSFEIDLGGTAFDFVRVDDDWRVSGGLVPIQAPYFGGDYAELTNKPIVSVPPTSNSPGTTGQLAFDSSHIYCCVATNVWVRTTLAGW